MLYMDRVDAGRRLAELLGAYRRENPFVLALPRGGVVVGYQIALALDAPLDVLIVRKLGAPANPEFGFGAIATGGFRFLDERSVQLLGLSADQIERVVRAETAEMRRRSRLYRGDRPEPELADKTVILVDDGLATGGTARVAIRAVRRARPRRLVLAVPVAPADTAETIRREVDEMLCPETPMDFGGISQWYQRFGQTADREVVELLRKRRERNDGHATRNPP